MTENHRKAPRILFVCLGNICRSPLAEAALRRGGVRWRVNMVVKSAGTAAYHLGEPPDPRAIAIAIAARHGIDIAHYQGRQIAVADTPASRIFSRSAATIWRPSTM